MTASSEINSKLQNQATEILQQISNGISTAGDIATKQLPEIAQQYIAYGFWKGLFASIISVSFSIFCICSLIWAIRQIIKTEHEGYIPIIFVSGLLGVFYIFSFLF